MRKNYQNKNIFCIEGIWDENNLKDQSIIEIKNIFGYKLKIKLQEVK